MPLSSFPADIDSFPTIDGLTQTQDAVPHDVQHNHAADAIVAIQAKLGIDGSSDTDSIDYRLGVAESDIDALNAALSGKSNVGHTHVIADVSGLQAALDGKAALSHTHTLSQITDAGTLAALNTVTLTSNVTGILPVANGGSGTSTAFTQGSVVFAGASGVYSQDNSHFAYDFTNLFLKLPEIRFGGFSFSRFGGDLGDGQVYFGYNFKNVSGTYKHDSTGTLAGIRAAANGLSFYTDTSQAADTTVTAKMFIDTSGNVGIGTTSPQGVLHSEANSASNQTLLVLKNSAATTNGDYRFIIGGVGAFDGGLKIGRGAFGNTFDLMLDNLGLTVGSGKSVYLQGSASLSALENANTSIATNSGTGLTLSGNTFIQMGIQGLRHFWMTAGGKIGINTPGNASAQLHVEATTASTLGFIVRTTDNSTTNTLTAWQNSSGTALATIGADGSLGLGSSAGTANLYRITMTGPSKNTVYYGLNTADVAAGDTYNYAVASNAVTGQVFGFNYTVSASTGFNQLFTNSNNTDSTANSVFEVKVGGASGGDPKFTYTVSGAINWSTGVDNSDSDKFKISGHANLGSNDYLTIDTSGNIVVAGGISVLGSKGYGFGTNDGTLQGMFASGNNTVIRAGSSSIIYVQDAGGTTYASFASSSYINKLGVNQATPGAMLHVDSATASNIGAIFRTTDNSSTKNLTEWQNSSGTALSWVRSDGIVALPEIRFNGLAYSRFGGSNTDGGVYFGYNFYNSSSIFKHVASGTLAGIAAISTGLLFYTNTSQVADTNAPVWLQIDTAGTFIFRNTGNFSFSTATGTKIGTGTTQKIGFWNAAPIVQPVNTVAIDTLLVNTGLRASGGTANFDTALSVNGPIATAFAAKTANYTLTATDSVVTGDTTGGAFTITLPTAVGISGRVYTIKRIDSSANDLTVATTSSQTIDLQSNWVLATQNDFIQVISDGANWLIISS